MAYDIIGDIHGHADALRRLLVKMEYTELDGVWRHAERTAIFLGDFIDRGPKQVETVMMVRRMVEAKAAMAIMGNHEFNAIAYYLKHPRQKRRHLRTHTGIIGKKNFEQHQSFLAEAKSKPGLHQELVEWFLTLPLWLDLPEIRVVHACWHPKFMNYLRPRLAPNNLLTKELMVHASREPKHEALKDNPEPSVFKAVEALMKGIEAPLPAPHSFKDKGGHIRRRVRVTWWNREAKTFGDAALLSPRAEGAWSEQAIPAHALIDYPTDKPLFFGHYWREDEPKPLSDNVACLDYSIAAKGQLVAYRTDGERVLNPKNFKSVNWEQ